MTIVVEEVPWEMEQVMVSLEEEAREVVAEAAAVMVEVVLAAAAQAVAASGGVHSVAIWEVAAVLGVHLPVAMVRAAALQA